MLNFFEKSLHVLNWPCTYKKMSVCKEVSMHFMAGKRDVSWGVTLPALNMVFELAQQMVTQKCKFKLFFSTRNAQTQPYKCTLSSDIVTSRGQRLAWPIYFSV